MQKINCGNITKNKLSSTYYYVLYLALAISIPFGYYFSIILPEVNLLHKEQNRLLSKLAIMEKNPRLDFYRKQLVEQQGKHIFFQKKLGDNPSIDKWIKTLKSGDAKGLHIQLFSPRFIARNKFYSQEEINIIADGDFYQLKAFIQNLFLFNIQFQQLLVTKNSEKADRLQIELLLHFFKRTPHEI